MEDTEDSQIHVTETCEPGEGETGETVVSADAMFDSTGLATALAKQESSDIGASYWRYG